MEQSKKNDIVSKIKANCPTMKNKSEEEITQTSCEHGLSRKVLPVKKIASVKRESLPAFIDSLSSYNWLTRGTFRQICNINESFNILPFGHKGFQQKDLDNYPFPIKENLKKRETIFGKFIRYYFDWLCAQTTESFQTYYGFTDKDIKEFSRYIMSPTQLEYAAALLARDLGFSPLFNIGKAAKDIDIRATLIHKNNKHHWKDTLKRVSINYEDHFSSKVLESLERGYLNIQCKNYFCKKTYEQVKSKGIVYFCPTLLENKIRLKDCLTLKDFSNSPDFKYLTEFFELSEFYYKFVDNKGNPLAKEHKKRVA